ncbi:unnamed protein product [Cladocopium goreaui]|uniref:Pentatricopeptide repeat-containing protein GUN1, chloroplastic (Pentatricopeptide repeat-containing protein At2g31400) (Protein GENOMES UNCOUPLED 1) n=1 Tax=Cladocopium goreaui TaxID=2562237 RepID=A0A9P1C157_9DINO|nr:unnamed protein product [Cladocopium goreaui]
MTRCFDLQQLLAEKNAMGKRSGAAGDDLPPGATPEVTTYNAMITRLRGAWCKGFLMFHQLNFIALQADILSFNSALALLPWRSALDLHSNTASLTASSLRLDGISFGSVQQSLCSAPWPLGLVLTERATVSATALTSWSRNIAATSATTASGWWLALQILGRSDDLLGMNLALHAATSASQWQDVLMTFEGAKAGGLRREPDVVSKGTLINALDLAQEWRFAFAVLVDGRTTTNTMCYNSASSSAAKTGHWQVSCQLLLSMSSASFEADLISFNAAASFGTSAVGRWAMASTVLQRAQEVSCRLSEVSFGASVVSAEWPRALAVMDVLRMEIQLTEIHCNAAISVCAGAACWSWALHLLSSLQRWRIQGDTIAVNSMLDACEKGKQWQLALHLLFEFLALHVVMDEISFNSVLGSCLQGCMGKKWHVLRGERSGGVSGLCGFQGGRLGNGC